MMTDTISYFLDSEWTCPLNFWCSNKGVSVITHTVLYLSYMLGISEIILENRFGTGYDSATLSTLGQASLIRSCCRARQIVLFHFTNGKKFLNYPMHFAPIAEELFLKNCSNNISNVTIHGILSIL